MRRLSSSRGNAIILALICVVLVGGLAAITFSRSASSEQRTAQVKLKNRAQLSVDAAVQMAIAKIQRVGSSTSKETDCSLLDGPSPEPTATNPAGSTCKEDGTQVDAALTASLNGSNNEDGVYNWTVRSPFTAAVFNTLTQTAQTGAPADAAAARQKLKQRTLAATGTYKGEVRRQKVRFSIIPRAFRYALFAQGRAGGAAVNIGDGANVLLPPPYKAIKQGRGGNLGADKDVVFSDQAQVNYRDPSAPELYDNYFLPPGANAVHSRQRYFNDSDDERAKNPWGAITVGPSGAQVSIEGLSSVPDIDPTLPDQEDSTVLFDGIGDNDGIQQMATATALPEYSHWLPRYFRKAAEDSERPNPYMDGATVKLDKNGKGAGDGQTPSQGPGLSNGAVYSVNDFRALVSDPNRTITFDGPVYVNGHFAELDNDCDANDANGNGSPIVIASDVVMAQGSLIVDGCDVEVAVGGSLRILHSSLKDDLDETSVQEELLGVHQRPAIYVARNGENVGGSFFSRTSEQVNVDGLIFVEGDMEITAEAANPEGNFINNGAVVVRGSFIAEGADPGDDVNVVLRWNPVVQRVEFDPSNDRMGTYSIRTNDQAPPSVPSVDITPPSDGYWKDRDSNGTPDYPISDVKFTWTVGGEYDSIECRFEGATSTTDHSWATQPWKECGDAGFEMTHTIEEADTNKPYRFMVRACNAAGCGSATQDWFQMAPLPKVTLTSKPNNPNIGRHASFAFSVDKPISTMECRLTGVHSWIPCGNVAAKSGTKSYPGEGHSALTYTTYTFDVRVKNEFNDYSYATWEFTNVLPPAPTVTVTSGPANPSAHTANDPTFNWDTGSSMLGANVMGSTECEVKSGGTVVHAFASCSKPKQYMNLATGKDYTFTVRVCNDAGCAEDTHDWRIKYDPPAISWITRPPNPSAYNQASPTFNWTATPLASITSWRCRRDEQRPETGQTGTTLVAGSWVNCPPPKPFANLPHNRTTNGNVYRMWVEACNESGCDQQYYDWRIYPDPPSVPYWGAVPPAVDYPYGSSVGWFETTINGAASNNSPYQSLQCYDARAYWYACDNGNAFHAGYYCSNTAVYIRAVNSTGVSGNNSAAFHRNCDPPAPGIWWTSGSYAQGGYIYANKAYGYGPTWPGRAYVTRCGMFRGSDWGAYWGPTNYCPGDAGNAAHLLARGQCYWWDLYVMAADNSRQTQAHTLYDQRCA